MKKIFVLFVGLLALSSCSKKEDFIEPLQHSVKVTTGEEFNRVTFEGINITLTNKETQQVYNAKTNNNGEVTVGLQPGRYNIQASIIVPADKMGELNGVKEPGNFNATIDDIVINKEENKPTVLTLVFGTIGDLIIKQLYYSGSDIRKGATFRDQFFEIHNNSDKKLYLDGLCFAQLVGTNKKFTNNFFYYQENGQYDFSKSPGTEEQGAKANTNYVYADEVLAFPGTGQEYPIEPGESVIVAGTALNHKEPLKAKDFKGNDKVYEVSNPELTIDLSKAKFEVYLGDILGDKAFPTDIDVPTAVNMKVLYKEGKSRELILDPIGRDAFVIFRATESDINNWKKIPQPWVNSDKLDTAEKYLQIPNNVIIDGVELIDVEGEKPKYLPNDIDSGAVKGVKGKYTSESAIRKVARKVGDRVIYQDTNNSSNDFEIIEKPDTSSLN